MTAPKNEIIAALKRGETQLGLWLGGASGTIAELAATAGFDWIVLDGEHGPNDLRSLRTQLRSLEPHVPVAVRLPVGADWMIKQVLDLGIQTVVVPMVETAEQAKELARAMRYAPVGNRGVGAAVARASDYGADADYMANANDEVALIVQVETAHAIENIDEISAVEGVDAVFIGPADLATDMGHVGGYGPDATHPEVMAAITHASARIRAAGKPVGIFAGSLSDIAPFHELGIQFMAVGSDVRLIREAFVDRIAKARAEL
ncbi:HpcH/HpaI aldolase/citrate lyase family protein [Falsihalocynthiibacter sp. SS001]|uniref:HpcH/HpaI aldolase family protein n=1 Tax=Falsihalocynthiibacter sp. SS001 TaxID=3349698 RepID=UPI0036D33182